MSGGKTSIALAIAEALNRDIVFINFSSRQDSTFLLGMSSSWADAKPGLLASGLASCNTVNPVFVLDKIDKGSSNKGNNIIDVLVSLLDPKQNNKIVDEFLTVEIDFSKVFFIATANYREQIPAHILDRFHIIEIKPYDTQTKAKIIRKYLKNEIQDALRIHLTLEKEVVNFLAKNVDSLRDIKRIIEMISKDKLLKKMLKNENTSKFKCSIITSDLNKIPLHTKSENDKRPVGFMR